MSDPVSAECAGIRANVDNKKADPGKCELDLGSGADTYKKFPLNDNANLTSNGLFSKRRTIHLYTNYRENL